MWSAITRYAISRSAASRCARTSAESPALASSSGLCSCCAPAHHLAHKNTHSEVKLYVNITRLAFLGDVDNCLSDSDSACAPTTGCRVSQRSLVKAV